MCSYHDDRQTLSQLKEYLYCKGRSVKGRGENSQNLVGATEATQECPHGSERQLVHLFLLSVLPKEKNDGNLHFIVPHCKQGCKISGIIKVLTMQIAPS